MTHCFDFLFWKGRAKRDLIFYSFEYKDFKYYGSRNMKEFEKESGRASEAFTTMIRHGRHIEGSETQMSALTHQADRNRVIYRSRCGKTTCAYDRFEMHTPFGFGYHIRKN